MRIQQLIKTQQVNQVTSRYGVNQDCYKTQNADDEMKYITQLETVQQLGMYAKTRLSREQIIEIMESMNVASMSVRENIKRSF